MNHPSASRPPTPRHACAQRIPPLLSDVDLESPLAPVRDPRGRFYWVAFRRPGRLVVGEVRVYSPHNLIVLWSVADPSLEEWLGHQGSRAFACLELALLFCELAFGTGDNPAEALQVPTRRPRESARSSID